MAFYLTCPSTLELNSRKSDSNPFFDYHVFITSSYFWGYACVQRTPGSIPQPIENKWRKRVGVEPTGDAARRHPPVLKTGTITGPHALPFLT